MEPISPLSSPFSLFLVEETGASILEYALVGLLLAAVSMLLFLAFRKGS